MLKPVFHSGPKAGRVRVLGIREGKQVARGFRGAKKSSKSEPRRSADTGGWRWLLCKEPQPSECPL